MRTRFLTAVAVLFLSAYTFAAGREIAPREPGPSPYRAASPQVAFAANADALRAPAITGSIVTLQEGDAADGARAVVYDERDLSVLPPRPRNPIPSIAPFQPGWVQVTWDAVGDAELYVVESDGDAPTWRRRHIIPANRLLRTEIQAGAIRVTAIGPGGASAPPPKQRSARQ